MMAGDPAPLLVVGPGPVWRLPDGRLIAAWCDTCGVLGGHTPGCVAAPAERSDAGVWSP